MFIFLFCLISCFVFWVLFRCRDVFWHHRNTPNNNEKKYLYHAPGNNYEIYLSSKEYDQVSRLEKAASNNEYCRNNIVGLFFLIRRQFPDVDKYDEQVVLTLCRYAVFRRLNYQRNDKDESVHRQILPDVYDAIDKECDANLKIITGKEDSSFYSKYVDAWEIRYANLEDFFTRKDVVWFYDEVCKLGKMNSVRVVEERKIYIKAHRFMVKIDREYSLRLYLHYLSVKSLSDNFKYNKIPDRNSKILFRTDAEKKQFDETCAKLLKNYDLKIALARFNKLKISQRKRITLNKNAIKVVAEKQSKVAGVLGALFADEPSEEKLTTAVPEEIAVEKSPKNHQSDFFDLFASHSFVLNKEEVDIFARSRGFFAGRFVEDINEECYDELDDVLIEEDDNCYTMNEGYYHQIKGKWNLK